MRAVKYLAAPWVGVLLYTILSLSFGKTGFDAYRQLEAEKARLSANQNSLSQLGQTLQTREDSLRYDKDVLTVYANSMGYGEPDQRFARIVGLGPLTKPEISPGKAVFAAVPTYLSNTVIAIIAFCAALTLALCMAAYDLLGYVRE
jgi:hypothetical protein